MNPAGFPHSEILESQLGCQLLEAYRRLLRPSSAPGAKASTVCPYKLDHRYKDARVHCAVLKQPTTPTPDPAPTPTRSTSTGCGMTEEPVRDRSNTPPHNPHQANLAGPAGPVCSFRTQQRAPHTTSPPSKRLRGRQPACGWPPRPASTRSFRPSEEDRRTRDELT